LEEELGVGKLGNGALGEALVAAQRAPGFIEIGGGSGHRDIVLSRRPRVTLWRARFAICRRISAPNKRASDGGSRLELLQGPCVRECVPTLVLLGFFLCLFLCWHHFLLDDFFLPHRDAGPRLPYRSPPTFCASRITDSRYCGVLIALSTEFVRWEGVSN